MGLLREEEERCRIVERRGEERRDVGLLRGEERRDVGLLNMFQASLWIMYTYAIKGQEISRSQ